MGHGKRASKVGDALHFAPRVRLEVGGHIKSSIGSSALAVINAPVEFTNNSYDSVTTNLRFQRRDGHEGRSKKENGAQIPIGM